jgi:hypothetical protein
MKRRGRALRRRYGHVANAPGGFRKVWFSKGAEKTAALILPAAKLRSMSLGEISQLFPSSEFRKMTRFHQSPVFPTWDAAFAFNTGGVR